MPKIRVGRYEFFFYSNENDEPPHVHTFVDGMELKFWLADATLATKNPRVGQHKINRAARAVRQYQNTLQGAWDDFHARR